MFLCNDDNGKFLDAFIKNVPLLPDTAYRLTVDHYGGAFGIWINKAFVIVGAGPYYFDHHRTWTTHEIRFTTAAQATATTTMENWSISFFKKVNSRYMTGIHDTYIDNVRLVSENDPHQNLLEGGDFEAPSDSAVYAKHWEPMLRGSSGKSAGIMLADDPLFRENHCLFLPKIIATPNYPENVIFRAEGFGRYTHEVDYRHHRTEEGIPCHLLVLAEHGEIQILSETGSKTIPSGHVLYVPPYTPFHYVLERGKGTAFYWITFSGSGAEVLLEHIAAKATAALPRLSELTAHIDKMLHTPVDTSVYPYVISAHLQLLLAELNEQLTSEVKDPQKQRIDRVAQRLREQPEEPLNNAQLAEECGFSVGHFIRLFKQYEGCTPHQYRLQILVQKACFLLRDTTLTIQEISFALGIENPLYFSRLFRSVQGVSPRDYRKQ